jgi:hypothetical protein
MIVSQMAQGIRVEVSEPELIEWLAARAEGAYGDELRARVAETEEASVFVVMYNDDGVPRWTIGAVFESEAAVRSETLAQLLADCWAAVVSPDGEDLTGAGDLSERPLRYGAGRPTFKVLAETPGKARTLRGWAQVEAERVERRAQVSLFDSRPVDTPLFR